jgi:hypothetical protein
MANFDAPAKPPQMMRRARRDLSAISHAATVIIKNLKSTGAATGADMVMPLPTSLHDACLCGKAKETLISLSVVDYSDTLDIHGQEESPLGVIQMLHDYRRMITQRRHPLNVFGDIHDAAQLKLPNKVTLSDVIWRGFLWSRFAGRPGRTITEKTKLRLNSTAFRP